MNIRRRWRCSGAVVALVVALAGCGGEASSEGGKPSEMTIAYQFGIAYAPLLVMKNEGWLEEALPGTRIKWQQLSSGAAVRDGMLADKIQVGSGGIGPFLVGYAGGVDWKLVAPLEQFDLWMMVKDPKLRSLRDFRPEDKIAVPAPDSIQAIVLRKAAQDQLGDSQALDENIVALAHPDAQQALLSGQVAAHLGSPPFQEQEQSAGARRLFGSYDVFGGPHTLNSVFVREGFHEANPTAIKALVDGIDRALALIADDPDRAARILSEEAGGEPPPAVFKKQITAPGIEFTTVPRGFEAFAEFMSESGLIEEAPESWTDLVYDNLKNRDGS